MIGAASGLVILAALILALGMALTLVPIGVLRLVFGLQWLRTWSGRQGEARSGCPHAGQPSDWRNHRIRTTPVHPSGTQARIEEQEEDRVGSGDSARLKEDRWNR